jgi:hypothetical protein
MGGVALSSLTATVSVEVFALKPAAWYTARNSYWQQDVLAACILQVCTVKVRCAEHMYTSLARLIMRHTGDASRRHDQLTSILMACLTRMQWHASLVDYSKSNFDDAVACKPRSVNENHGIIIMLPIKP